MKAFITALLIMSCATAYAEDLIPVREDVPFTLTAADKIQFDQQALTLDSAYAAFKAAADAFSAKTAENQTDKEFDAIQTQRANYIVAVLAFNKDVLDAAEKWVRDAMIAHVKTLPWQDKEKDRAVTALNTLKGDGDDASRDDVQLIWKDVQARRDNDVFAWEASQGKGPGMPGAGGQTNYQDCAVFSLANAAGVPYGVAAARAAEFIKDATWRSVDARRDVQQTIEKGGLNGGEVILVAEALGEVRIVPSGEFVKTLESGRPVMVNFVPYDGAMKDGHEVVLTKTFQHEGGTWYEMIDSNEAGAQQRLYLNEKELRMLLKENGVTVTPDEKTVIEFLSPTGAE